MAQRVRHWMTVLCTEDADGNGSSTSRQKETYEAASVLVTLGGERDGEQSDGAFSCDKCHRPFKRKGDLKRHVRRVHEKIRDAICPVCSKAFGEDYNMRRHINRVHSNNL